MKDLMKRVISFTTFDYPERISFVSREFETLHSRLVSNIPYWSSTATTKKMVGQYWFYYVLSHFVSMMMMALVLVVLINGWSTNLAIVFVIISILSFPVFLIFNYWPNYYGHFIPTLETVKENYQHKQLEKVEKCRQMQLSNLSLALVYYVLDKTSGINTLEATDRFSLHLTHLFGVDNGSLKKNIMLILNGPASLRQLTDRRRTEIRNKFSEAYEFLEALPFPTGVSILKELEMKCRF